MTDEDVARACCDALERADAVSRAFHAEWLRRQFPVHPIVIEPVVPQYCNMNDFERVVQKGVR